MLEQPKIDVVHPHGIGMLGDNTLWLPETDHAGIATQMVSTSEAGRRGPRPPQDGS